MLKNWRIRLPRYPTSNLFMTMALQTWLAFLYVMVLRLLVFCSFSLPKKNLFSELQLNLAQGIGNQLGTVVSNILANEKLKEQLEEINRYKEQLEEEKQYLQEEVSSGYTYSDIIGTGPEMQKLFHQLSQVSFTDSTVLVLGETGTGKELVARAINFL